MLTSFRWIPVRLLSRPLTLALTVFAGCALSALADAPTPDTVVLSNGDHLSGAVTQIDGGKLTLHTEYAGDVVIDFSKISSVKLQKAAILSEEKKRGKKIDITKFEITEIENSGKQATVTTTAGTQTVPAPPTVRTPAAQKSYEQSLNPNWGHAWTGTASINFALARGNSNTTTIGTGATAVRPTRTDKTSLYYTEIYTHDGVANTTSANNASGGARYDHNLNPKLFVFGTGDFYSDALQQLTLREVLGGGFGWHAYSKKNQQFDVLGGLVWTHEHYDPIFTPDPVTGLPTLTSPAITNSFAALDFGETYNLKLSSNTVLAEQAYIFPDMSDLGQYRATFNTGVNTKIKSFLSWQANVSDVYVTNPPTGTKTNDFILTTGLGFTFTRK